MIISYKWLKEFIDTDKTADELAALLTKQGIETGKVSYLGGKFSGVVSAEILEIEKHPDADKLSVCKVTDGKETFQIVCGAKNIFVGAKIPLAKLGAKLPGDFEIKRAKLRGVESFGMLCSEKELGLSDESKGIAILPDDTQLGKDMQEIYELDDYVFEVEITPNRGDCLSVLGVSREISVALNTNIKIPDMRDYETHGHLKLDIEIKDKDACSRYMGYAISNITNIKTPMWMQNRLRKSGLRSINFIVDITNYMLLEFGHPMHAFDYDKIKGSQINIRFANAKEKLVLLDGSEVELTTDDLVIADEKTPLALAGIMGGMDSGVTADTKTIVFESAYFNPSIIRKSSRSHGVSSDSSYRFERGVCINTMELAIKYALHLLKQYMPMAVFSREIDEKEDDIQPKVLTLRKQRVELISGIKYTDDDIVSILSRLRFKIEKIQDDKFRVTVPTFRNDIEKEIDLIEEIARIYGYDNIAGQSLSIVPTLADETSHKLNLDIKKFFTHLGFLEARNYSFSSMKVLSQFSREDDNKYWKIINPLSEEDNVLVNTRLPRLIMNASQNIKYKMMNIKLFEIGKTFLFNTKDSKVLTENESLNLAGIVSGLESYDSWKIKNEKVDFYYVSGLLKSFLEYFGVYNTKVEYENISYLDKSYSAKIISSDGKMLGVLGKLNKKIMSSFDIKQDMFVWELYLDKIFLERKIDKQYSQISQYPFVERDLSLLVPNDVSSSRIIDIISSETKNDVLIFDMYEGDKIPSGYKNIAVRFILQPMDKTFSDAEINAIQESILSKLAKENIKLRT